MTQIIAISNQKGGVAKTTSCISLGACLAEQGNSTLIVDLDPQAHLTLASGFDPEDLDATIVDLFEAVGRQVEVKSSIQITSLPGLDVLPADLRLAELEWSLRDQPDYEWSLSRILEPLHEIYEFILLDCPPSLGGLTLMALTASDFALIPVQCDYFATRGLMRLLDIVTEVKQRTNPRLRHGLFVTLFDSRPLISRRVLEQLHANFGNELFNSFIGMDTKLRESVMANEPVITYASKTRASEQYRDLARELKERVLDLASIRG